MLTELEWATEFMVQSANGSGLDVLNFVVGARPTGCENITISVEYHLPTGDSMIREINTRYEEDPWNSPQSGG